MIRHAKGCGGGFKVSAQSWMTVCPRAAAALAANMFGSIATLVLESSIRESIKPVPAPTSMMAPLSGRRAVMVLAYSKYSSLRLSER